MASLLRTAERIPFGHYYYYYYHNDYNDAVYNNVINHDMYTDNNDNNEGKPVREESGIS